MQHSVLLLIHFAFLSNISTSCSKPLNLLEKKDSTHNSSEINDASNNSEIILTLTQYDCNNSSCTDMSESTEEKTYTPNSKLNLADDFILELDSKHLHTFTDLFLMKFINNLGSLGVISADLTFTDLQDEKTNHVYCRKFITGKEKIIYHFPETTKIQVLSEMIELSSTDSFAGGFCVSSSGYLSKFSTFNLSPLKGLRFLAENNFKIANNLELIPKFKLPSFLSSTKRTDISPKSPDFVVPQQAGRREIDISPQGRKVEDLSDLEIREQLHVKAYRSKLDEYLEVEKEFFKRRNLNTNNELVWDTGALNTEGIDLMISYYKKNFPELENMDVRQVTVSEVKSAIDSSDKNIINLVVHPDHNLKVHRQLLYVDKKNKIIYGSDSLGTNDALRSLEFEGYTMLTNGRYGSGMRQFDSVNCSLVCMSDMVEISKNHKFGKDAKKYLSPPKSGNITANEINPAQLLIIMQSSSRLKMVQDIGEFFQDSLRNSKSLKSAKGEYTIKMDEITARYNSARAKTQNKRSEIYQLKRDDPDIKAKEESIKSESEQLYRAEEKIRTELALYESYFQKFDKLYKDRKFRDFTFLTSDEKSPLQASKDILGDESSKNSLILLRRAAFIESL